MRRCYGVLLLGLPLWAQPPALQLDISGDWRFQRGDNPAFSRPEFDDSNWESMRLPRSGAQPVGYWWLRRTVEVPDWADSSPLALTLGGMNEVYEVFVNGARIAAVGESRLSKSFIGRPRTFAIPPMNSRHFTIALRLWYSGWISSEARDLIRFPDSGPYRITYESNAPIEATAAATARRERYATPRVAVSTCIGILAILLLLGWWSHHERKDLALLAGFLLSETWFRMYDYVSVAFDWSHLSNGSSGMSFSISPLLLAYFLSESSGLPLRWLRFTAWSAFGYCALSNLWTWWLDAHIGGISNLDVSEQHFNQAVFLSMGAVVAASILILWSALDKRLWQRAVAPAAVLLVVIPRLPLFLPGSNSRAELSPDDLLIALWALGMTAHLIRDLGAARQRLAGEMEAARTVQQLLLKEPPSSSDSLFQMATVYKPAQEVGGDFHWHRVAADHSLIVVVGDVSGKGLKAAMLVSVAMGILRNEKSSSPAGILEALNDGLAGHTGGSFVTCCCAHFDPDGTVTLANAGHPAPYCTGRELELEAGLPLGIAEGVRYAESLVHGASFTFVSDGVVEAVNAKGELFGFERTREISGKSSKEIAETAKAWGQNDDITVVTVRRLA